MHTLVHTRAQEHKPLRSFVCNVLFGLHWKAIGQLDEETGERGSEMEGGKEGGSPC